MIASLYINIIADLGEGAIWDHKEQKFHWIDIEGGKIFTFDPLNDHIRTIPIGQRIGTVVPSTKEGYLIVALQNGIYSLDLESEALDLITDAPFDSAVVRFNDGKCDPAGRLWVGSMALDAAPNAAALYRLERSGSITQVLDNITTSNGICWSADNKTMYYIDTPTQVVQAFDYDQSTGVIKNGHVVIDLKEEPGSPDGMAIDEDGKLWIALYGGSCVVCCDPDTGKFINKVNVPAKNVTSCAFGGRDLTTLIITTASIRMTEKEQQNYPHAGSVFAATPGVKGVKSSFFSW